MGGRRTRLYELLWRRHHVVLLPAGAATAGLGRFRSPLTVAEARVDRATLVRPDGYVAARARGDRLDSLISHLRALPGDVEADHVDSTTGGELQM